jgi:hypothetical protein
VDAKKAFRGLNARYKDANADAIKVAQGFAPDYRYKSDTLSVLVSDDGTDDSDSEGDSESDESDSESDAPAPAPAPAPIKAPRAELSRIGERELLAAELADLASEALIYEKEQSGRTSDASLLAKSNVMPAPARLRLHRRASAAVSSDESDSDSEQTEPIQFAETVGLELMQELASVRKDVKTARSAIASGERAVREALLRV